MARQDRSSWRARPVLAGAVRALLLAVPLLLSTLAVMLAGRLLGEQALSTWWGLTTLLVTAVVVAVLVERGARRLLPLAVLLRLTMAFPDRAPSRFRLTREAVRTPSSELVWSGGSARPITTSEVIVELVAALGRHDRRTRGHSERVRVLSDVLAAEAGLDQDARERLHWAALLHDVGKLSVPPAVLNKASRLDEDEFARVRQHPQAGLDLAAPLLPWLGEWGEGILDHHEKFDGSGYPAGKSGTSISAAGRLIAVVDAFETMTAARPYKKAIATRAAREELARCAGSHFDPLYVRAFLAVSLPRLLWSMGWVSFLLQLPFLRPIAEAGVRAGAAGPQAGAAMAGAAGAAVLVGGGAAVVGDATGALDLQERRPPAVVSLAGEPSAPQPVAATRSRRGPAAPAVTTRRQEERPRTRTAAVQPPRAADLPPEPAAAQPPPVPPAEPASAPAAAPGRAKAVPRSDPRPDPRTDPRTGPTSRPVERAPRLVTPPPSVTADVPLHGVGSGPAVLQGPPAITSATTATFLIAPVPGVEWECQLLRNTTGGSSSWEPCLGWYTVDVRQEGANTLRVRQVDGGEPADTYSWTVVR